MKINYFKVLTTCIAIGLSACSMPSTLTTRDATGGQPTPTGQATSAAPQSASAAEVAATELPPTPEPTLIPSATPLPPGPAPIADGEVKMLDCKDFPLPANGYGSGTCVEVMQVGKHWFAIYDNSGQDKASAPRFMVSDNLGKWVPQTATPDMRFDQANKSVFFNGQWMKLEGTLLSWLAMHSAG